MDRRQFLGTVAGAGAIGWIGHYFLGRPAWAGDEAVAAMGDVAAAYRRAKGLGKPLLVLVIPATDDTKYERGQVFGALLNHGGTGVNLDLALCELVCATAADVTKQVDGVKIEGDPLMVLVETGETPRAVPINPEIKYDLEDAWEAGREQYDKATKERLDKVAASLRAAVAPDRESVAVRAALAQAHLPADEVKALRAAVAAGKAPPQESLDRGAAIVRAAAEDPEGRRPQVLDALAAAAAARITGKAPPGAKWAKSSGCGTEVEGEPPEGIECGMGYVPKISQRFLWFFTKE